ncbi:MAG: hypothetical protein Q8K60_01815, partial [Parachlamydiaceae bacterium]|nr:hypothetical protein [Parachlamydiaceae bacterium]
YNTGQYVKRLPADGDREIIFEDAEAGLAEIVKLREYIKELNNIIHGNFQDIYQAGETVKIISKYAKSNYSGELTLKTFYETFKISNI